MYERYSMLMINQGLLVLLDPFLKLTKQNFMQYSKFKFTKLHHFTDRFIQQHKLLS